MRLDVSDYQWSVDTEACAFQKHLLRTWISPLDISR